MNDKLKNAYKLVANDMIKNGPGFFVGRYDAEHGKKEFMAGIQTVMEYIIYNAYDSNEAGEFSDKFIKNMIDCREKYKNRKKRKE